MTTWQTIPNSSNIARLGYAPETEQLYVEFKQTGSVAIYDDVSESRFAELMAAESKGAFFTKHIRNNPDHPWRYA
jgi:KTSC domain-containing protein